MTMTWTGRQLTTLTQNGKQNTYKYDVDGLRLEKTAGGVTTQYQYVNGQLLGEKRSNGVILRYTYDALGVLSGIQYKNTAGVTTNYIVRCTLSGDVDQIFDTKGSLVARYIYDTWGNTLSVTDASGKAITDPLHIANINPIRYRGYYYDAETGLYYLQSRYYDTVTKRYINPDGYVFTGQDMQSGNMFAYCGNQPVDRCDQTGNRWEVAEGGYGGGGAAIIGGGLIYGVYHTIKRLINDIATTLGRYSGYTPITAAQTNIQSQIDEIDITIADSKRSKPESLYFGAQYRGNSSGQKQWNTVTAAMTKDEIKIWINTQDFYGTYGKHAAWGVYTPNQIDAYTLGTEILPDGPELEKWLGDGEYPHYHPSSHYFRGKYGHFHIWYGAP